MSRSDLVARTGLTRSAIRSHVSELHAAGVVAERPPARLRTPGRPSPVVALTVDRASVLALEIAVDSLAAAHVGPSGEVIASQRVNIVRGHRRVDDIVAGLRELVGIVHPAPIEPTKLVGIGVAVPGLVSRPSGIVRKAPNLGWTEVPLGELLADALATDVPIRLANEADLGALAESRRGAAVETDDVIYVSGEVGVGGGIIVDGQPLAGAAGYGGEIGHIPVDPAGRQCRCGAIGCWETEIGEEALLRLAGQPTDGGRSAVNAVLAGARAGDQRSLAALEQVGRWLGLGLAGQVNVFNPQLVVLGGYFARLAPHVLPTVAAELDRRALSAPRNLVGVVPAALGDDAPLLGAAELAIEPLLVDPAAWLEPRSEHAYSGGSTSSIGEWRAVA